MFKYKESYYCYYSTYWCTFPVDVNWSVLCDVFVFFQGHHKHEGYHRGPGRLQRVFPGVLQHRLPRCIREQAKPAQIGPQNQMYGLRQAHRGQSVRHLSIYHSYPERRTCCYTPDNGVNYWEARAKRTKQRVKRNRSIGANGKHWLTSVLVYTHEVSHTFQCNANQYKRVSEPLRGCRLFLGFTISSLFTSFIWMFFCCFFFLINPTCSSLFVFDFIP